MPQEQSEVVESTHVILTDDHGEFLAGRVLRRDPELLARLRGAKYRDATPDEIAIAGTP
jgi:hypothetical protein